MGLRARGNNNLVPSGLGLRPECMFVSFFFISLYFILFAFSLRFFFLVLALFLFSLSGVRIYHGFVSSMSSLQVIRDGIRQLLSAVPCVRVLRCTSSFSSTETLSLHGCFVTTGQI